MAFAITAPLERILPEFWPDPLPLVVDVLERYQTWEEVAANLPDIELTNLA